MPTWNSDYVPDSKDYRGIPAKPGAQADYIPPTTPPAPPVPAATARAKPERDPDLIAKNSPAAYAKVFSAWPFLKKRAELNRIKEKATLEAILHFERSHKVRAMVQRRIEEMEK